ncbi:MAG: hypothetical protein L6R38_002410 [Xanthoria sp. 2 TBL-2021]|nr:MAG: hypothetical protein L6R38_002410 [Xanthoria sp. 2 TBL-2021]
MASKWLGWPRTRYDKQATRLFRGIIKVDKDQVFADAQPLVDILPGEEDIRWLHRNVQSLPSYDKGIGTRNTCMGGLIFSWLASIACITLARWTFKSVQSYRTSTGGYSHNRQGERVFFLSTARQEIVKLAVNVCISACTDCLGYIHSVSTRWALRREGRLRYNSNARLVLSTPRCSSSRWSTNLVSAFLLMICYASSGQLFLSSEGTEQEGFVLNGIAISALGIGLLGQAMISTVSIWGAQRLIPSWSSNPLNTTLVCLHHGTRAVASRCMLSVHQLDSASLPSKPLPHQASAQRAMSSIRHIVRCLWAFVILTIVWALSVRFSPYFRSSDRTSSDSLPLYGESVPALQLNLCALLITTSLQLFLTLSLHLTELLVNLSRDEQMWRLATSKRGTQSSFGMLGSLQSAVCSWQTDLLFMLKSLAYWLFSLAINSKRSGVYMNWVGILVLLAGASVVACFGTFLAWTQPSGPQPAAFGHIETLANLIDEWYDDSEKIWWGDKTVESKSGDGTRQIVRHAGTGNIRLERISIHALYR